MSKAVAFSGDGGPDAGPYWPTNVPKEVRTPRFMSVYDRLVVRRLRDEPAGVALRTGDATTTFAELDERVAVLARGLHERLGGEPGRMVVATDHPVDAVATMLAALRQGSTALLLPPGPGTGQRDLFDAGLEVGSGPGADLSVDELASADPGHGTWRKPQPGRPALGIPWGDGIAVHSETSLLGATRNLAAFLGLSAATTLVTDRPPWHWEGLLAALSALESDTEAILGDGSAPLIDLVEAHRPDVAWTSAAGLVALATAAMQFRAAAPSRAPRFILAFIDGPLPVSLRRRARRLLRSTVLTAFGTPATGVLAASAAEWTLDDAAGTPITGVEVYPIDPEAKRIVEPPWDLLTHAVIGASGQAIAVDVLGEAPGTLLGGDIADTGVLGRVDGNGLLFLIG